MSEALVISVIPDVDLLLELDTAIAQTYRIAGPPRQRALLESIRDAGDADSMCGRLSPLSPVTLPSEFRPAAGIPLDAVRFAFIHPLPHLAEALDSLKLNLAMETWAFVVLIGGFAYFDANDNVIAVNSLTLADHWNTSLSLIGPFVADEPAACEAMVEQLRMVPTTIGTLFDAGFTSFGWVHPAERFDGVSLGPKADYEHGAFLYQMKSGITVFYALTVNEEEARSRLAEGAADKHRQSISQQVPIELGAAMKELKEKSEQAAYIKAQAGSLLMPVASDKINLMRTVSTFPSDHRAHIIQSLQHALIVAVYLGIGVGFYRLTEDKPCEDGAVDLLSDCTEPWSYIDSFYFVVVTMSTVGYGDLNPTSSHSRLFTAVWMLLGIGVVFHMAGGAFDVMMRYLEAGFLYVLHKARLRNRSWSGDHVDQIQAWQFYARQLGFYVVVGFVTTQILFAYVFTQTQDELDFETAMWHCWETATTVGYGAASLTTQDSRMAASFHILLSVSWLAGLISRVQEKREHRHLAVQRAELLRRQMDESLISLLDRKGQGTVNQLEFVIGMLIALGAKLCGDAIVWETDVQPLLDRFDALDANKNGELTRRDLEFMLGEAKRSHKAAQAKRRRSRLRQVADKAATLQISRMATVSGGGLHRTQQLVSNRDNSNVISRILRESSETLRRATISATQRLHAGRIDPGYSTRGSVPPWVDKWGRSASESDGAPAGTRGREASMTTELVVEAFSSVAATPEPGGMPDVVSAVRRSDLAQEGVPANGWITNSNRKQQLKPM